MSARDLINAACAKANAWRDRTYATAVLDELSAAGYVILSPDEVRGMERDRQAVEFAARWCWRTDPPNAHNKLTDAERLSVIKHHPTIKQYGQPHIELAEKEAVESEARENYQRHVEEVNRATDAEIAAAIRSMKGGRDAQ